MPIGEGFHLAVLGDHDAAVAPLDVRARATAVEQVTRQYMEPLSVLRLSAQPFSLTAR